MYTAVVFFFSGTGNTWWVADRIKRRLDAQGINASVASIDSLTPKKADWWIKTADLILFGWPVYYSDLPLPVKQFIRSLPALEKGKHIHTFCTQTALSGDGAWVSHSLFESKGLTVDTCAHFIMPSNQSHRRGAVGSPDEASVKRILSRCEKQIDNYVNTLLSGKARRFGRLGSWLGAFQRILGKPIMNRAKKQVGVCAERCTRCGLCVSICPVHNMTLGEPLVFSGQCVHCMRCYAFCPQSAITFSGRVRDTAKHGRPYTVPDKHFQSSTLIS